MIIICSIFHSTARRVWRRGWRVEGVVRRKGRSIKPSSYRPLLSVYHQLQHPQQIFYCGHKESRNWGFMLLGFEKSILLQGSYRLEYAVVSSVHGRLKLGKPENRDKIQRPNIGESGRDRTRHHHQPPPQQHHQRGARLSRRRQSDQNFRGVDLLEHLVNDENGDENDYEKPFY